MQFSYVSKKMIEAIDHKTRYLRFRVPYLNLLSHRYFSINKIDSQLEEIINKEHGFYCELGANNGIRQSNTAHFEFYKKWSGVLIEPYISNYKSCIRNRSKKNSFYRAACVSSDYVEKDIELHYIDLMSYTPATAHQLTDPETHHKNGLKHLQKNDVAKIVVVPAMTLTNILISVKAPKNMDLLSLDVEGAEINVLEGLDHQEYRFEYMCIESRDVKALSEYLERNEYTLVGKLSPHDYLYKDNFRS